MTRKVYSKNKVFQGIGNHEVESYLGIRYAKPPIGELRFKAPRKIDPCSKTPIVVDDYPTNPIQKGHLETSEDFLFLNVWKPSKIKEPLPVMVWVYGGSFETGGIGKKGSGIGLTYDGQELCKDTGCIIITLNYRLNVFGFLDFSSFSDKFDSNIGIKDVVCALEWIQSNIAEFGGDANNVTLFGQSAGGTLIGCLNKIPSATHLYHKMIIQSPCIESVYNKDEAKCLSKKYLDLLGISEENIEALLTLYPEKLISVNDKLQNFVRDKVLGITTFCPVIDGELLLEEIYKSGYTKSKPLIIGSTKNEARLFTRFSKEFSQESGERIFPYLDKDRQKDITSHYPNFPSFHANSQLLTDVMYTVPKYWLADNDSIDNSVYVYRFDFYSGIFRILNLKACHIIDVPIQFNMGLFLYVGKIHKAKQIGKKYVMRWVTLREQEIQMVRMIFGRDILLNILMC